MYDLIGDIHGHAEELAELLKMLGYRKSAGVYRHPERQAIFVGDFIDRGPRIRETLEIVRPMVDGDSALAVMGNHEWNALAYHTADPEHPGEYLRRRSENNVRQHGETVRQLDPDELGSYLTWFRTLPMWLDLEGLRVVHACWDHASINNIAAALEADRGISSRLLETGSRKGIALYESVEVVLKGKEASLPAGISYADKDGQTRDQMRVRWYASPVGQTYRSYSFTDAIDCDMPLAASVIRAAEPYPATAKPVFAGHYWLSAPRPAILAANVACLDYSVAKGGFLCAYRWQGEQQLDNEHFIWATDNRRPGD
jgi:hypothetical protein